MFNEIKNAIKTSAELCRQLLGANGNGMFDF